MNLSKKSRYGITALIDLAVYAKDQCVQLSSIAERNNISVKYLEQIHHQFYLKVRQAHIRFRVSELDLYQMY